MKSPINHPKTPPEWKADFKPLSYIFPYRDAIDKILSESINLNELNNMINRCNIKLLPGLTKMLYKFYKKSSIKLKKLICNLFNLCIQNGTTSYKWIKSELILLLKPWDWGGNLSFTHLIILLMTLHKVYIKLLTNRITFAIQTFQQLFSLNWISISGGHTIFPIQTLHNIIEHARSMKLQLWIILQDISKAFDSIEPYFLIKTLERIHFPSNIISSIMTLAENHTTNAITEYKLVRNSHLQRGIDQDDLIFLIL